MTRKRVSTGFKFEDIAGYSRAIVDGEWILVSGTVGYDYRKNQISADPAEQTEQAIRNIEEALAQCGATLENIVRLRVYITERENLMAISEVVGRHFRPYKPANTTVIAQLNAAEMKVEIEATARLGSVG